MVWWARARVYAAAAAYAIGECLLARHAASLGVAQFPEGQPGHRAAVHGSEITGLNH